MSITNSCAHAIERLKSGGYTRRIMFSISYTFTKRTLGLLLFLGGLLGFLGILAIDLLDVGREGGIGPAQQVALSLCVAAAFLGITLIPLGKAEA